MAAMAGSCHQTRLSCLSPALLLEQTATAVLGPAVTSAVDSVTRAAQLPVGRCTTGTNAAAVAPATTTAAEQEEPCLCLQSPVLT